MGNKEEILKKVQQFIDRAGNLLPNSDDEQEAKKGKEKLDTLLSKASDSDAAIVREIRGYEQAGEVESRKLYGFCLNGYAAEERVKYTCDNSSHGSEQKNMVFISRNDDSCTETENDRYLGREELVRLYKFINERKSDKTFGAAVFEIMDKHKMDPPQVYKEAMLSRQDFSRVTGPKCKGVKRTTVWSLIIGLHCNMEEANYLLYSAGISRRATVFDLILEFMIITKNYDIMAINDVLYSYNQPLLACHRDVNDNDSF